MTVFGGKGVYGAIALGKISVFKRKKTSATRTEIDDINAEKERLEAAKQKALKQLEEIHSKALVEVDSITT